MIGYNEYNEYNEYDGYNEYNEYDGYNEYIFHLFPIVCILIGLCYIVNPFIQSYKLLLAGKNHVLEHALQEIKLENEELYVYIKKIDSFTKENTNYTRHLQTQIDKIISVLIENNANMKGIYNELEIFMSVIDENKLLTTIYITNTDDTLNKLYKDLDSIHNSMAVLSKSVDRLKL